LAVILGRDETEEEVLGGGQNHPRAQASGEQEGVLPGSLSRPHWTGCPVAMVHAQQVC
jgi:hypothetical protein